MNTPSSIHYLLFDLGGVLYDIDIQRTVEAYTRLQRPGAESIDYGKSSQHEAFSLLDRGEIDIDGFASFLRDTYQLEATLDQIKEIWLELLIGVFPGRAEDLAKLALRYRIALLSNTSRFHHDHYRAACEPMFRQMDHLFFSFNLALRKPDPAIYHTSLQLTGWQPQYTLFVDDSKANIEAAAALGIQTFWMETPDHWEALMNDLLA